MEFLNYVDKFLPPGVEPPEGSRTNKAKNCGISIFRFTPNPDDPAGLGFTIESVLENDVAHLSGVAEDRFGHKGNA